MLTVPKIEQKPDQPFAAIVLRVSQPEIANVAPPLIDEVISWVNEQGGELDGPPFFNYVGFYPGGIMEMHVGMPTTNVLPASERFVTGTVPGGDYATVTATAPYNELHNDKMQARQLGSGTGAEFAGREEGDAFVDGTRLEIYHKDPGEDPSGHPVTEIAFRLK